MLNFGVFWCILVHFGGVSLAWSAHLLVICVIVIISMVVGIFWPEGSNRVVRGCAVGRK